MDRNKTVLLASCSDMGRSLASRISAELKSAGLCPQEMGRELTAEEFAQAGALIFVCACGIAVRRIAPFIKDKQSDPAVVVLDELGTYCIALLSGHAGGANRLALWLSSKLGSTPVVTTATDIRGVFAVDVFAKENGLVLRDKVMAKEISAALLRGEKIYIKSGIAPEKLHWRDKLEQLVPWRGERGGTGIVIGNEERSPFEKTLFLRPKNLTAGIGCRKGKSEEELVSFLERLLSERGLFTEQVIRVCSVDLKEAEPGLVGLAKRLDAEFTVFDAASLEAAPGEFSCSEFVRAAAGTGNVCERSAVLGSGGGKLLISKRAERGMTAAVAEGREECFLS